MGFAALYPSYRDTFTVSGAWEPVNADSAHVCGKLKATNPQHPIDKQIAAVALIYDLVVVTRNTSDFGGTGVALLDPFR